MCTCWTMQDHETLPCPGTRFALMMHFGMELLDALTGRSALLMVSVWRMHQGLTCDTTISQIQDMDIVAALNSFAALHATHCVCCFLLLLLRARTCLHNLLAHLLRRHNK